MPLDCTICGKPIRYAGGGGYEHVNRTDSGRHSAQAPQTYRASKGELNRGYARWKREHPNG